MYQWVDEQGNVGFTDNPENIPEKYRQSATQLGGTSNPQKPETDITPTEPPSTPPSTDANENAAGLDDQGHDEQWWQDRMQELRHRKEALVDEKERLTTDTDTLGRLGLGSIDQNQQAKETENRLQQIDSEIKEIDNDLTITLPEEARRANAPPGWLRE